MKMDPKTHPMTVHARMIYVLSQIRHTQLKDYRATGDLAAVNWHCVNAINATQCALSEFAQDVFANKTEMDADEYQTLAFDQAADWMLGQQPETFDYFELLRTAMLQDIEPQLVAQMTIHQPKPVDG